MTKANRFNSNRLWAIGNRIAGLLVATLIGFIAALPFIRGIPQGVDTLFHLFRAVQLDALIREGVIYSRWAPDLVHGFGYPLFNYYAPAAYYWTEIFNLLGLNMMQAFLATYVLSLVLASIFTYLWVRDLFGEMAALVASSLYVFSPYMMDVAVRRGALAEQVALALLPLILWAYQRYLYTEERRYAVVASLGYALLILTHNISALIFTPILLAYIVVVAYTRPDSVQDSSPVRVVARAFWLVLIGVGMTAFYWLPALFERDLVQLSLASGPLIFDYQRNFLTLSELLPLPFTYDPNLATREMRIGLGLVAFAISLLSVASIARLRSRKDLLAQIIFAALVVVVCTLLTLSVSTIFWERFQFLQLIQFPWRFLSLDTLFIAFLAGVGTAIVLDLITSRSWIPDRMIGLIPAILILLTAIVIFPWQFADYYTLQPEVGISDSQQYERASGLIGTTSTGEYLPIAVQQLPGEDSWPEGKFDKLDHDSLPDEARILSSNFGSLAYDLVINSPSDFTAIFKTFYFDGWQVKIDGQQASLEATDPNGLLSVSVPAGKHQLQIQFQTTPVRQLAGVISAASLALFLGTLVLFYRRPVASTAFSPRKTESLSSNQLIFSIVALLLVLIISFVVTNQETVIRRSRFDGQMVTGIDRALDVNFDNQLVLMGFDQPRSIPADEPAEFILYWRVPSITSRDYSASIFLVDENNVIVGQHDNQYIGNLPTSRWLPAQYAQDRHAITLKPGVPPGKYDLKVALYESGQPDRRLSVLDDNGSPAGQELSVSTLNIIRPENELDPRTLKIDHLLDQSFGEGIKLLGYAFPEFGAHSGEAISLILYWQATIDPASDISMQIGLTNEEGQLEQSWSVPLVGGFPTPLWRSGDIWRAEHPLLLAPTLSSGKYTAFLTIGAADPLLLGSVEISAPEHTFQRPPVKNPQKARFDKLAELEGFDTMTQAESGDTLPVTLIWRSLGETQTSYKSFVQLLDDRGRMVVGSDKIPDNWIRPTTGWVTDEYIVDSHLLQLPATLELGSYRLLVGFYDSDTLRRLLLDNGGDALILETTINITQP